MATNTQSLHPVFRRELRRKSIHLLALTIPVGMVIVGKLAAVIVLGIIAAAALTADIVRAYNYRFGMHIRKFFGSFMRPSELPPPGGPIVINGATWVFVAAFVTVLVFPVVIAAATLAMFLVADAVAAIVGMLFGRTPWPGTHRTVQGSIAFFVMGLTVLLLIPAIPFDVALFSALVATAVEALPKPFNDNVRVPIVTAILMAFLFWLTPGESLQLFFAG